MTRKPSPPRVLQKVNTRGPQKEITARKCEILQMLADGETPSVIAARLGIKNRTVKSHLRLSQDILGANSRAQMIARAVALGYVHVSIEYSVNID